VVWNGVSIMRRSLHPGRQRARQPAVAQQRDLATTDAHLIDPRRQLPEDGSSRRTSLHRKEAACHGRPSPRKQVLGRAYLDASPGARGRLSSGSSRWTRTSRISRASSRPVSALDHADVVIGSGYIAAAGRRELALAAVPVARRQRLTRGRSWLPMQDCTAGFVAFSAMCRAIDLEHRSEATRPARAQDRLTSSLKIVEVPIVFAERAAGSSKMSRHRGRLCGESSSSASAAGLGAWCRRDPVLIVEVGTSPDQGVGRGAARAPCCWAGGAVLALRPGMRRFRRAYYWAWSRALAWRYFDILRSWRWRSGPRLRGRDGIAGLRRGFAGAAVPGRRPRAASERLGGGRGSTRRSRSRVPPPSVSCP